MISPGYRAQVELLLRIVPEVAANVDDEDTSGAGREFLGGAFHVGDRVTGILRYESVVPDYFLEHDELGSLLWGAQPAPPAKLSLIVNGFTFQTSVGGLYQELSKN